MAQGVSSSSEQARGTANGEPRPVNRMASAVRLPVPPIFFVSGLPRSGSTLLMNLLGQHPLQDVTPTSGLIDMLVGARNQWMHNTWFKAEGLNKVQPKIASMLRGMLRGFHEEALSQNKVVFDKNRGWIAYIELLEEVLQERVKILVTVRDIKAVVASFEKLHRQSTLTKHALTGDGFFEAQTIEGRARQLLAPGAVVGLAVNRIRDALERGLADRLLFVPYRRLTLDPRGTMARLHAALRLYPFPYDPDNVVQITQEDDTVHGMELHTIRTRVRAQEELPWTGVLPERVCAWLDQEYADINRLAGYTGESAGPVTIGTKGVAIQTITIL